MFKEKIKVWSLFCLIGFGGGFFYLRSLPSNYQAACSRLFFTTVEQQEALFNVFKIAGYLEPQLLWSAMYRSRIFDNPESAFVELVEPSNFLSTKKYSDIDFAKLILYMSQTAFDRKVGQERCELNEKAWMVDRQGDYFECAERLGLMQSVQPDYKMEYDAALVLGASRPALYPRLMELNHYLKMGLKTHQLFVLTGQRELWAEIDGFHPHVLETFEKGKEQGASVNEVTVDVGFDSLADKVEEGRRYMKKLADACGVAYDQDDPFEMRGGRSYLRMTSDGNKITEVAMAQNLLVEFALIKLEVIDNAMQKSGKRPDTVSTAKQVAHQFVQSIVDQKSDKKVFNLIAVTNNPYVERQTIAVQREFDKALDHFGLHDVIIKVHGAGFKARRDVANIHSEIGALCSELFKDAYPDEDTQHLTFRSRDNNSVVPGHENLKN
jgi:hypothetical protein